MCKIHHIEGNSSNYDQSLQTQSRTKTECNEKMFFFLRNQPKYLHRSKKIRWIRKIGFIVIFMAENLGFFKLSKYIGFIFCDNFL